jgi:hypothetical protein
MLWLELSWREQVAENRMIPIPGYIRQSSQDFILTNKSWVWWLYPSAYTRNINRENEVQARLRIGRDPISKITEAKRAGNMV